MCIELREKTFVFLVLKLNTFSVFHKVEAPDSNWNLLDGQIKSFCDYGPYQPEGFSPGIGRVQRMCRVTQRNQVTGRR